MPNLPFLPNPPLPFTGSYESDGDGGWRKMRDSKWRVFKGGNFDELILIHHFHVLFDLNILRFPSIRVGGVNKLMHCDNRMCIFTGNSESLLEIALSLILPVFAYQTLI